MSNARTHPFLRDFRIHVDPRYEMENFIVEHGMWEPHVVAVIQYFVQPESVCADVGANAGYHSLAMAQRGGTVYAFEPDGENYRRLLANLQLNPQILGKVKPLKLGLSSAPGTLKVFKSGDKEHLGNSYLGAAPDPNKWTNKEPREIEECEVTTLDESLSGNRLDFLKVDVEGMELEVLKGARRMIDEYKPAIVYESLMNNFDNENIRAAEELLRSFDYHFFYVEQEQFKLKPTCYPNLRADTVAVHGSKLDRYVQYMDLTAAQS